MARPTKKTVDYFPHMTAHGKTIFVLESRWGNDGYAFWFRLLELIGSSEGLFYNCNNAADWQFLLAKTRVTEDVANEILSCLSDLGAIDAEIWAKRVVFSQKFVDGVADAFSRRKELLPSRKDIIDSINLSDDSIPPAETGKGKGKERKGDNTPPKSPPGDEEAYRTKKGRNLGGRQLEMFNLFWSAWNGDHSYPKGKASAADAWLMLNADQELFEKIIRGAATESKRRKEIIDSGRTAILPTRLVEWSAVGRV